MELLAGPDSVLLDVEGVLKVPHHIEDVDLVVDAVGFAVAGRQLNKQLGVLTGNLIVADEDQRGVLDSFGRLFGGANSLEIASSYSDGAVDYRPQVPARLSDSRETLGARLGGPCPAFTQESSTTWPPKPTIAPTITPSSCGSTRSPFAAIGLTAAA